MTALPPSRSVTRATAIGGLVALVALLVLGGFALTTQLTHDDLAIDQAARGLRSPSATPVFLGLTGAAQEAVGLIALAVGLIILWLRRRRYDAARLLLMAGASWVLAVVVKYGFDRPRPPATLWLLRPDATGSFPSGHDTTATVMIVIVAMVLVGTGAWRVAGTTLAVLFALAVGVSRVYLGDHYPTDVLGSYLTVTAATLLVKTVTDLPRVRHLGARLLRVPRADDTVRLSDTDTLRQR
jgi:undecaprenyl-diphosphatase